MAKNYAGFNYNGGAQYVPPPTGTVAAGYNATTGQSGYPIIPNAAYGNEYQTAGSYASTGVTPNTSAATYGYDYSQSYYQQASVNYNTAPPTPTVSKTHYSSPPVKNTNVGGTKAAGKNKVNGTGKSGPTPPTAPPPTVSYVNYDAIYSAASLYVQQQQQQQQQQQAGKAVNNAPGYGSSWSQFKGGRRNAAGSRSLDVSKSRLHYCEVCKISCAGPQSYREHLDGQKHKKREASSKMQATAQATTQNKGNNQHCELCDVTCTGNDAYAAHVRGSKHQRVFKLHQKLGKPIPSDEPKKIEFIPEKPKDAETTKVSPGESATKGSGTLENDKDPSANIKPVGGEYIDEIKDDEGKMISFNCKLCECKFNDPNAKEMHMKGRRHRLQYKRKVQPDLVVDFKPTPRQRFLAEARAQRTSLQSQRGNVNRGYYQDSSAMYWDEQQRGGQYGVNEYENWSPRGFAGPQRGGGFGGRNGGNGPPSFFGMMPGGPGPRRLETIDDRYAIARHAEIYPKEEELQVIQRIVSHTERALKFVSDSLAENPDDGVPAVKKEKPEVGQVKDGRDNQMFSFQKEAEGNNTRILKGVMRVGFLAKGLLLQGDNIVELVVLCAERPTVGLLKRVAAELPTKLKEVAGEQSPIEYQVTMDLNDAAIIVSDESITVTICLTSPMCREVEDNAICKTTVQESDDAAFLPLAPCLQALAELRRAKWFQARATGLQSCVMTIRLLRDLCHRVASWQALPQWSMELLVEKVISSAGGPLPPGECLRRIMEALSTGFLINGPGLADPCEKEARDSLVELGKQQREDLTVAAQEFLRYIAFRQIYKVLGMDPLPTMKFPTRPWLPNRKRLRPSGSSAVAGDDENARDVKVAKI